MAIPEKRQAGSAVLWLGVIIVAAAGVLFLPRDKAVRAVDRIRRMLSHSTDTAALRKLCGLLEHVVRVWVGPPSWMHGLYHHLRGDPDPAALARPGLLPWPLLLPFPRAALASRQQHRHA
eukprot:6199339-Pleurochrysis_carterae.AAC.2